jgi:hypothetical protein
MSTSFFVAIRHFKSITIWGTVLNITS